MWLREKNLVQNIGIFQILLPPRNLLLHPTALSQLSLSLSHSLSHSLSLKQSIFCDPLYLGLKTVKTSS